jgi:hypothetical protein
MRTCVSEYEIACLSNLCIYCVIFYFYLCLGSCTDMCMCACGWVCLCVHTQVTYIHTYTQIYKIVLNIRAYIIHTVASLFKASFIVQKKGSRSCACALFKKRQSELRFLTHAL